MRAGRRLSPRAHGVKRRELEEFWSAVVGVEVSRELIEDAARLAERHTLRAYDAVHLASALLVGGAEGIALSCWDKELRAAAGREGLALEPA
jgi:predicted nucleic acid-binding protein